MNNKKGQTIIIPSYRPESSLVKFVKALSEHFSEILVVDDGGRKDYKAIFDEIRNMGCAVLIHSVNQGKGRALKTAFNHCYLTAGHDKGVITVDGDGQHRVEDIVRLAEEMEKHPGDVVLGCRSFSGTNIPLRSRFGNNFSRLVYRWACGLKVSDTQTGLRGIPYNCLPLCCQIAGEKYEYETNMLLAFKDNGVNIREISIQTVYENKNESSHFNPIKDSIRIYAVIIKYTLSSLLASIVDYIVFGLILSAGSSIIAATYTARAISCVINFTVNKRVVFARKGHIVPQIIKYAILAIVSGGISGTAITFLTGVWNGVPPIIIKIPVEVILYFFNYEVQRVIVFAERRRQGERPGRDNYGE